MFLIPLLLSILIVWIFAYFFRSPQSNANLQINSTTPNNVTTNHKAMEILKERYAKGDIAEDEYLKIKRNLE